MNTTKTQEKEKKVMHLMGITDTTTTTTNNTKSTKKPKPQPWKKALLHCCLCFVMGFFIGFAPSSISDWASISPPGSAQHLNKMGIAALHVTAAETNNSLNRSLLAHLPANSDGELSPRGLLIVITTTDGSDRAHRAVALTRMSHTLRLVPPPVLWVVVEAQPDVPETAKLLRSTGVMYRHLTCKENFTDSEAGKEAHTQRNVALGHIEHHRLAGVVHFAGLNNVYDLQFFEELRSVSAFGAWPVATVSADEERVLIETPVCTSSKVVGWFSKDMSNRTVTPAAPTKEGYTNNNNGVISKPPEINVYGFGFNSSVLWDPERWGRHPTTEPDTSQDSMRFVQEIVLDDQKKLIGIPSDCSQIMVWNLQKTNTSHQPQNKRRR